MRIHGPRHRTAYPRAANRRDAAVGEGGFSLFRVLVPKFVLGRVTGSARELRRMALEAGILEFALDGDDTAAVPNACYLRALELAAFYTGDPDAGLRAGADFTPGRLGIYDYLFLSAPTLGDGHAASWNNLHTITDAGVMGPGDGDIERDVSVNLRLHDVHEDRAQELALQVGFADIVSRSRWATGRRIDPVEVRLRQRAPRRAAAFREMFGTARVVFGADADILTFRAADLALPLRTADPVLAAILLRHAATLPPLPATATSFPERLQQILAAALAEDHAPVSLAVLAQRMALSTRTLQRRLAEAGTTWRHELDQARQAHLLRHSAMRADHQAALLRYSDTRALRRAQQRWATAGR
jgi:AraC-like DNA-binding protein